MVEASAISVSQLSDRARTIFRDIVDSYLTTGAPVGSRTLSRTGELQLSPASIRNVMQDLEELGLLAAPHTSAGRVPTEQGLRLFVDGMMQAASPSAEEIAAIEAEAARSGASLEDVLTRTTAALSGLAQCAAVVAAPRSEAIIRQLNLVPLGRGRALAVLVGADGSIENRVMALPEDVPPQALEQAQNYVNARLSGLTLADAVERLQAEMLTDRAELDRLTAGLVAEGLASWSSDGARPVLIVRGQAHLLDSADLDRARALLEELEEKAELARLLDEARSAEALRIFIGAETRQFALSGSSVIAAPYRGADGRVIGVVGVIGPTRLNYARVVPMVDFTANRLSRLMA
ncbi:heat-inducible transcriptional repressor HrcA [Sandaracinobacter sp. RS1-74]|uniref:heat-inducible transcriptional repressor HrcA n=1 Tax=Sandaracinobacteroides sayramensis TaxID=2913411 RepID=UPI001ED9D182|nr:heat-inducible transcriptional repressor HrcA [Sandaracinobacteroides sayramensis]MCG2839650.1 heat-inducible transcriptional repressor HrcA [Sandaracinobacteroides sayramensis]